MKILLLLLVFLSLAPAVQADDWHVVGTIAVPGNGGWDYLTLDPGTHRLYIARATRVQVLDVQSGELVGEIADTAGVHGIALVPALGRGFTSNGKDNSVSIVDLSTLKTLSKTPVGKGPDAIIYDATSGRVFTMNGDGQSSTAIQAASGQVAGNIPLSGNPEFAAVDGRGHLFINLQDKSQVVEVDTRSLKVVGQWPLAPGEHPTGMAIDAHHHRLFIGCHNKTMVIFDTVAHTVDSTVPIGDHVDACTYDPALGLAFSSNGDGTLTVVGARPYRVLQNVSTQDGARTMALDPLEHRVYLCTARRVETLQPLPAGTRPQYQPDSFVVLVVGR